MRADEQDGRLRMSPSGRRLIAVGLAVIGLLVAVFAARFGSESDQGFSPVIGNRIPDLTLPRLGGAGTVELRNIAGAHDVVVVNFFASWCIQCRNEHADLVSTADAYHHRSVGFVGIAFQDRPARAISFLDELGWGATTDYLVDPGSRAAIDFGIFGVPETVFVRNGVIVAKLLGESSALSLSGALEQLLSGEDVESRQVGEFRRAPDDGGRVSSNP